MKHRSVLLLLTAAFLGVTQISPLYPREQILQHIPTAIVLCLLGVDCRKQYLTWPAFCCTVAFFWLHIFGARWIYSGVPYDDWCFQLFGVTLRDTFQFQRNHYDRLVHFAFGWLFLLASFSTIECSSSGSMPQSLFFSFCVVTALSGIYEVFEWLLTVVMAQHDADAYNGQQGDVWDAQKDIGIAMIGSVIAMPFVTFIRSKDKTS